MVWALKDAPTIDTYELAVLVVLAETADDDGCGAFLSVASTAQLAKCSKRQVVRIIQDLMSRGLLAVGNQDAAKYLDPRYRPVVYDLLIPYGWFPSIDRISRYRSRKGRAPITPDDRPEIPLPPDRPRRSDFGKPKPRRPGQAPPVSESAEGAAQQHDGPQVSEGGLLVTPEIQDPGVTSSTARGDYDITSGVTSSHPNQKFLNQRDKPTNQGPPSPAPVGSTAGWLVGDPPSTDTPGSLFLALLPVRYMPAQHAVARLAPKIDVLLDGGWTSSELLHRLTDGTRDVGNPVGVLIRRLDGLLPRPAARPRPGRFTPDQAEAEVSRLAGCSQTGAEKAAKLLGTQWVEPYRGRDEDAKSYLLGKLPAAAREYVEQHRAELVAVLTGANTTTKGVAS